MVAVSMTVTCKEGLCTMIKNAANSEAMHRHGVLMPLTVMKA